MDSLPLSHQGSPILILQKNIIKDTCKLPGSHFLFFVFVVSMSPVGDGLMELNRAGWFNNKWPQAASTIINISMNQLFHINPLRCLSHEPSLIENVEKLNNFPFSSSLHRWSQGLLITVFEKQSRLLLPIPAVYPCHWAQESGVTPSTLGNWDQEVPASVSPRSWKSPGGWWNDRDDLAFSSRIGSWAWMEVNPGCEVLNSQKIWLEELCL